MRIHLCIAIFLLQSMSCMFAVHAKSSWSYQGKTGPEYWGKLSSKFRKCSDGVNQSPINITGGVNVAQPKLVFTYTGSGYQVANTGHMLQVTNKPGSKVTIEKQNYNLKKIELHTPSEHTIGGRSYPMEAHFIHTDKKGILTIIAVMFRSGRDDKNITAILKSAPKKKGSNPLLKALHPMQLLPQSKDYFMYTGSLTSPPCSEGVRWIVMKNPVTASDKQMRQIKSYFGKNNRPLQPLNSRMITK